MTTAVQCSTDEMIIALMSREYRDGERAACGALSFVPAAAMLLAAFTRTPNLDIIIRGYDAYDPIDGPDFHFMGQRGQLDVFHVSGIEIDQQANFNLHVIGDRDRPDVIMPGQYGTGMLYYVVPRIIMHRTEHRARMFPQHVSYVSGAGSSPDGFVRRTREVTVITPLGIMRMDPATRLLRLAAVHPGVTVEQVQANTGFDLGVTGPIPTTEPVTEEEIRALRTVVRDHMIEMDVYAPEARRLLAGT